MNYPESVTIAGREYIPKPAPPAFKYIGWRCLHVAEGGYPSANGMPEVRPSINIGGIYFNQAMQLISFDLMKSAAPTVTGDKWRAVYDGGRAFTNNQGFNMAGDPRADYINKRDIGREDPKLMKAIICGGMFVRGIAAGDELIISPGVGAIDGNKPIPDYKTVLANNWYFTATTQKDGKVSNFPQTAGNPCLIPYILKQPARYPLAWFVPWEADTLPDPLKVYLPK